MRGSTLSDTPLLTDTEVAAAIAHLDSEGYCLLKNRIPREVPTPKCFSTFAVLLIYGCNMGAAQRFLLVGAGSTVYRGIAACSA